MWWLQFAKGASGKTYPHVISLSANVDCGENPMLEYLSNDTESVCVCVHVCVHTDIHVCT